MAGTQSTKSALCDAWAFLCDGVENRNRASISARFNQTTIGGIYFMVKKGVNFIGQKKMYKKTGDNTNRLNQIQKITKHRRKKQINA